MESPESGHLGVLTFAFVLLLPVIPAAWKAASWRGDMNKKWSDRVDIAHAGLNERATRELVDLQGVISLILGVAPAEVWTDPDPLIVRANLCAKLLRARDRLRGRFRKHLRLGPILIPTLVAYSLGWLAATLYFTEVVHESWVKLSGFLVGGLAAAVALTIFVFYAYFEAKLTAAEEIAAGTRG